MAKTVIVIGNPADGFTLIGPVTPNDPDVDEFIDRELRNDTWWYVEVSSIKEWIEKWRP